MLRKMICGILPLAVVVALATSGISADAQIVGSQPGWVYSNGIFTQNGAMFQALINASGTGASASGTMAFVKSGFYFRAAVDKVTWSSANDITVEGKAVNAPGVRLVAHVVQLSSGCTVDAHAEANGVVLWATGPTWPAATSSPVFLVYSFGYPPH